MKSARVPNFLPSMSGFHFENGFFQSNSSDIVLNLPVVGEVPLGDPSAGLCGGMVFAAVDFFVAQPRVLMLPNLVVPKPPQQSPPAPGDPLFDYLLQRLLDSFVLGLVGPKTLTWLVLPTHGTWFSTFLGFFTGTQNNIAWLMVNQEWPAIQADLDAGRLSPLGLVSDNLNTCHQVLAHGYDLDDQGKLIIYCYNPNEPSQDGAATLKLNISQSYNTIPIQSDNISANDETGGVVFKGIFHAPYSTIHAAASMISGVSLGSIPSSPLALQPLAPGWNAWESLFSSILFDNDVTIQTPSGAGNPVAGPYALLGSNPASTPSVCSWGPNRLDLFIQDQTGFADHLSWDNGTMGLDQLQQLIVSSPCAVSWGSGRVDAFAVLNDLDYSLVHFWLDGGVLQQTESLGRPMGDWNTTPIPLDGSANSALRLGISTGLYFATPPCVCSWGSGRLDIFAAANRWDPASGSSVILKDATIVHLTYNGSWSRWERAPLRGGITVAQGTSLMAVSWATGRLDLFMVDVHWEIRHCSCTVDTLGNETWSAWENLNAPAAGFMQMQPTVVSWSAGRLDLFGVGTDGNLYHQWYDTAAGSAWAAAWENLEQPPSVTFQGRSPQARPLQGNPAACSWAQGRLDIVARGTDVDIQGNKVPALWHLWFDGTWHSWESLGGVNQSDPAVVTWAPNRLDLFAAGGNIFNLPSSDFVPWHIWFQG